MSELLQWLQVARAALDGLHPAAFPLVLVLAIWLVQYAVRRWLPGAWEWAADLPLRANVIAFDRGVRKAWQALPSVVLGAVGLWSAGGGRLLDLVLGAVLGVLAPVLHELLKAAPIAYRGGQPPATRDPEPP